MVDKIIEIIKIKQTPEIVIKKNKLSKPKKGRVSPALPPMGWSGFEKTTYLSDIYNNFSNQISIGKTMLYGGTIGGLIGLTYGFWDYFDEKKINKIKGTNKKIDKNIIIKDTLYGLLGGVTLGALGNSLVNNVKEALNDKKATEENKKIYDNLLGKVSGNMDKNKAKYFIELHKDNLTDKQYKALMGLADVGNIKNNKIQSNLPNMLISPNFKSNEKYHTMKDEVLDLMKHKE